VCPRLPVDGKKVSEIRHTLGTKERMLLEQFVNAQSFNKIATPVVAGMSDVSFMLVLGSILTAFFPNIVIPAGVESIDEIISAIVNGIKDANREGFGGLEYGVGPIDTPRSLAKLLVELILGEGES